MRTNTARDVVVTLRGSSHVVHHLTIAPASPLSCLVFSLLSLAMSPLLRFVPLVLLQFISLPTFSAAYSWVFDSTPKQCSNVSIAIKGSDGQPPYRILIIPFGPTPLPNNTEVRRIIDHPFEGNSDTTSLAIDYPANSQFVAVVSGTCFLHIPRGSVLLCTACRGGYHHHSSCAIKPRTGFLAL